MFGPLPDFAAFRFVEAVDGFEVAYLRMQDDFVLIDGYTSAVEDGEPHAVAYSIELDPQWRTRQARLFGHALDHAGEIWIDGDGEGQWYVEGEHRADLDGCLDLDIEASALTNAFPVRRLGLAVGDGAEAPAAFVRALDLGVERLEQRYERIGDGERGPRFDYESPASEFRCVIEYDASGLVVEYPEIAVRAA